VFQYSETRYVVAIDVQALHAAPDLQLDSAFCCSSSVRSDVS